MDKNKDQLKSNWGFKMGMIFAIVGSINLAMTIVFIGFVFISPNWLVVQSILISN